MEVVVRRLLLLAAAACAPGGPVTPDGSPREAVPLPITGGTLAALGDGGVVVADAEGARLFVVDVGADALSLRATVSLPAGARPGRVAVDADDVVWAVLRGAGGVARVVDGVVDVIETCPDPRGVDTDGTGAWVACAGGELVHVRADGEVDAAHRLSADLRDVVVRDEGLWVSRFRTAEVVRVDPATGDVVDTRTPPVVADAHAAAAFPASVAWRLVDAGEGVLLAHQRATADVVDLDAADAFGAPAYGGASCDAVVQSGLTFFPDDGGPAETVGPLLKSVLPVDVFVRGSGEVGLVAAGAGGLSDVAVGFVPDAAWGAVDACTMLPGLSWSSVVGAAGGRVTAAVDTPAGVVIQTEAPLGLVLAPAGGATARLDLAAGVAPRATALFHLAPTGSVACASCHPEGGEDGLTWRFVRGGHEQPRRTQSLAGGAVLHTAPLHWDGEHADVHALVEDTLGVRIGAEVEDGDAEALAALLASTPAAPVSPLDADAAARGEAVFAASGCRECHDGPWLTDGRAHDVGTVDPGGRAVSLHTPSLVGVGARGPWMHDGCAETLRERFEPGCGGDAHGDAVVGEDLEALLAWLASR